MVKNIRIIKVFIFIFLLFGLLIEPTSANTIEPTSANTIEPTSANTIESIQIMDNEYRNCSSEADFKSNVLGQYRMKADSISYSQISDTVAISVDLNFLICTKVKGGYKYVYKGPLEKSVFISDTSYVIGDVSSTVSPETVFIQSYVDGEWDLILNQEIDGRVRQKITINYPLEDLLVGANLKDFRLGRKIESEVDVWIVKKVGWVQPIEGSFPTQVKYGHKRFKYTLKNSSL